MLEAFPESVAHLFKHLQTPACQRRVFVLRTRMVYAELLMRVMCNSVGTYCSLQGREDLGRAVDRLSAGPPRKTPSLWVKKERERTGQEDEGEGAEGAEGGVGRAFQSPGPAPRGDFGAFFSLLARCSDGSPACRTAPAPLSPNIGVHPNSLLPLRRLSNLESYASHLCSQRQRPAVVWSAWCDDGSTG